MSEAQNPMLSQIRTALHTVQDPEIRRSIDDLGMIDDVSVGDDGVVTVKVLLTVAGCRGSTANGGGRWSSERRRSCQAEVSYGSASYLPPRTASSSGTTFHRNLSSRRFGMRTARKHGARR